MDNNEKTIAVIGAGAWGTALSQNFASAEKDTTLWARVNHERAKRDMKPLKMDK